MRFLPGLLLLLPLASPFAQAELIDDVNDRGELRIALEGDMRPFSFKEDGRLTGFEVELGELLARELEVNPSFITTDAADLLQGVESGKYDIAINHIALTPELKDRFDFSEPYSYTSAQLIVRKEEQRPLGTLEALKGHALGVAQGSQFVDEARTVEGVDLRSYPNAQQPLKDVADKQIDAAISDRLLIPFAIRDSRLPVKEGAPVGPTVTLAIPFQKGNPAFQASIDRALQRIKADGRLMALSEKWFGMDASEPPKP
ncbi:transporter substrate-binding domain-containing protein [Pseudomonas gingeri]|uniref:Transporter substrate-binding domain-containing protein n=1 Tax=Pseudomonas gingeri TaxID=117681 RepID=A0A7Y7YF27_9PSED|nr:transporter substrate-binding domain-containing protein [Pseudomonas gingeri]NWA01189.1 transporter substrate-binding domain-containing protein [Pseudomonas gingeri]NWA15246.1 transporter substrate-binding domain-containing protein [Pseudomonas gingeri]NWA53453.1 transporter substrate-binding domain-containing protein [Pseudomonas gingeri]NWA99286.1 transporter substrate-binding domain-containing protein [Pseudomonas gingeri]NWB04042.1 transporter substrate-binding domain-containing protein